MLMRLVDAAVRYNTGSALVPRYRDALMPINLEIDTGETVGLVGESGSGKSTVSKVLGGLMKPYKGRIEFEDLPVQIPFSAQTRRQIQMIFQHPEMAFDPKMKLLESLKEAYNIYHLTFSKQILLANLQQYGLYEEHIEKYPSQLSGGEIQRACLARSLVLQPKLLILDEVTSMLDVISQAQMIRLLLENQKKNGTAYLFITHDWVLANKICQKIYRIEKGTVFLDGY